MLAGLRRAKVTKVHPEANAVDLVFLDNGARSPMVQVLSFSASTNSGHADLTHPTAPGEEYDAVPTEDRDIYAVVGFVGSTPIVIGFLFPQVCQLLFKEPNRRLDRHGSDFYTTVDDAGNWEMHHPSGSYLRIGVTPAHEDLTGKDFDKKFKITRNTDKAVHFHMEVRSGGALKAKLDLAPNGDVALEHTGNLSAKTGGNADVDIAGALTSKAASWAHTGDITVQGTVTATTVVGTTDVTAAGKSLKSHVHTGVTAGPGVSGPPQ